MRNKLKIENRKLKICGFTLVELMIVVAILGILAGIVIPEFQGHIQKAKESAAKDNLRILREAIERYAFDHNGVPPGYLQGNTSSTPTEVLFNLQLTKHTNNEGGVSMNKTGDYPLGSYLMEIPDNPLNKQNKVHVIDNAMTFPVAPTDGNGWVYKPSTKELRLDTAGTDTQGADYFNY